MATARTTSSGSTTNPAPSSLYAAVEIGHRLANKGLLARHRRRVPRRDRASLGTARRRVANRTCEPSSPAARRRRAWVAAHPGPASYGTDRRPPRISAPSQGRWEMRRLLPPCMLGAAAVLRTTAARPEPSRTAWRPGSPCRRTGPSILVRDEAEVRGCVPETSSSPDHIPGMVGAVRQAGAVVTDGGGVLAHTAVIAREYGMPAVLATGAATQRLH